MEITAEDRILAGELSTCDFTDNHPEVALEWLRTHGLLPSTIAASAQRIERLGGGAETCADVHHLRSLRAKSDSSRERRRAIPLPSLLRQGTSGYRRSPSPVVAAGDGAGGEIVNVCGDREAIIVNVLMPLMTMVACLAGYWLGFKRGSK